MLPMLSDGHFDFWTDELSLWGRLQRIRTRSWLANFAIIALRLEWWSAWSCWLLLKPTSTWKMWVTDKLSSDRNCLPLWRHEWPIVAPVGVLIVTFRVAAQEIQLRCVSRIKRPILRFSTKRIHLHKFLTHYVWRDLPERAKVYSDVGYYGW